MADPIYPYVALLNLVKLFTTLSAIPETYSPLLLPLYCEIKKNDQLSFEALKNCKEIFAKWNNGEDDVEEEVVKRCMDMWLTINGEDYILKKPLSSIPNITRQEAETNDYVGESELQRIEFDPITNEPIKNPLGNLIIEEVEATEYVGSDDDHR
ncbi:Swm2p TDEL_0B05700 [Torulaspora delbrueckii]|uniref:Nucleolar protein SWM2 n=1 Tax=Torulaspora delbrueckii TaxID=4950 RepID=G8ZQ05_TORDE|nr:hypothetical protein TDEL_0B05700 [Torulaspora delbrueckii]CCE90699.1 hypothetical protein TDEL_0B05700 [Torulaspora delbrueckii]